MRSVACRAGHRRPGAVDGSGTGANVLDLFGGSGSTLIAVQQTGRRTFLMELDPLYCLYCDVIVQRHEQFTGVEPERNSVLAEPATAA